MPRAAPSRAATLLICLGLAACGFRLAGTAELADSIDLIRLETTGFSERQRRDLAARLEWAGARVVDDAARDAALLRVDLRDTPPQTLVSGTGKAVERVTRSLRFSLADAAGRPLIEPTTLTQQRDFARDEDNLLASNEERANLLRELEKSLFDQIIFQLSRI